MKVDELPPRIFRIIEEMPWETMSSAPRDGSIFFIRAYPEDGSSGDIVSAFFVNESEVGLPDGSVVPAEGSRFLWVTDARFSKVLDEAQEHTGMMREAACDNDARIASISEDSSQLLQEFLNIEKLAKEQGGMSEALEKRLLSANARASEIEREIKKIAARHNALKAEFGDE